MADNPPLPSLEECNAAINACLNVNDGIGEETIGTWRKVIQQCLSHGTHFDRLREFQSTNKNKTEDDIQKELSPCAVEAGKLLASALEGYLTSWHQNQVDDIKSDTSTSDEQNTTDVDVQHKLKDDPIICAVVEAIWMAGCLLHYEDDTGAATTAAAASSVGDGEDKKEQEEKKINPKKVPHQCLLAIIRELVTPRSWLKHTQSVSENENEAPKDGEEDAAKDEEGKDDSAMDVDDPKKEDDNNSSSASSLPLIPITLLQTTLELSLLQSANLLPNPPTPTTAKQLPKRAPPKGGKAKAVVPKEETPKTHLEKRLKKINTDMFYRQHKFNLLAEESEGYAKLWVCLVGGGGGGGDGDTVSSNSSNGEEEDDAYAAEANKYIRELIGAFDLDPNRVLDLALDAIEWELNNVVVVVGTQQKGSKGGSGSNSKSSSSSTLENAGEWWGIDKVRGAMSSVTGEVKRVIYSLLAIIRELDGHSNDDCKGRAVAHLLGFKYRSYHARHVASSSVAAATAKHSSDGKSASIDNSSSSAAIYPRSLHLSTAFLCAHNVLDVHALIPHLAAANNAGTTAAGAAKSTPAATTTSATAKSTTATSLLQEYQKSCGETIKRLKKLGVVSLNSAKADKKDDDKGKNAEAATIQSFDHDPIIDIFRALLAVVGDWDIAVAFLAHASVADFASIVNGSGDEEDTEDKLRSAMDLAVLAACTLSEGVASDICVWVGDLVDGPYREIYQSSRSRGHGSQLSILPETAGTMTLTKDSSLEEMSSTLKAPLSTLVKTGKIRVNQNLYIKLCRLYKHKLTPSSSSDASENDPSSPIDDDTLSVLSTSLVPSLSLFPSDTILPTELWAVLKHLPYDIRYKLYSSWRHPGLEKGTLRTMLPKDVRQGKVPKPLKIIESEIETGIAARYVLKRISKDNIGAMGRQLAKVSHNNPLVVFTDILGKIESYDNLILMMVDTFEFVTELGLDVMGYCLLVSLGGGDEAGKTRSGTKMGGLNTEQWLASLETFTGAFYKKFPNVELRGILVYLTKRFKSGQVSELGVLRSLIKTCGGYGFVDYDSTSALSDLQLDGRCGSRLLKRETSSFGVVDDINRKASQQLRSVLQGGDLGVIILILLSQVRSQVMYSKKGETVTEHVKVIGNTYDDCEAVLCLLLEYLSDSSMDPQAKEKFAASLPSLHDLHEKYGIDTASAWMLCRPLVRKSLFYMDDSKLASKVSPPAYLEPFAASEETTDSYKCLLPQAAWKHITPTMFEMFYSLAIYDVTCPEERYKVDIDRLKKDCERLSQFQKGGDAARGQMAAAAAAAAAAGGNQDQIRQATAFTKTHAMELDRLKRNVDQLTKDFQRQQKRCKLVLSKLEAQKDAMIVSVDGEGNNHMFAPAFMTFCIYSRCLLSPEDSLFCAHFIKLLHQIKVPGFMTIELIDNIVNAITGSFYNMTEDEAGNCSIFLNEIWKTVNSWRYDNDTFASELKDTPGSQLSKEFAEEHDIEEHALTGGITHDDYKALYSMWHEKIASAAIGCLKSTEYMHTRAALIVLSRIVLVFPTQPKAGEKILKTLSPLQSDDNARPDIRATAQGYCSQLMKARDEGMWKEENMAVTKARHEKEKLKAEERKKKLAKQHEDMKKENEMLSRQLGGGRDGWRPDRRDDRRDDRGRPRGMDPRMQPRGPPLNAGAPNFTPKTGDSRELHGRPAEARRQGADREVWERDRGRQSENRDSRRPGGDSGRGDRDRRKRSRSPEPGEDTERQTQKRSRGDRDYSRGGPRSSDRRGGGGSSRY